MVVGVGASKVRWEIREGARRLPTRPDSRRREGARRFSARVTPPTRPPHDFGYTPADLVDTYTPPEAGFAPRHTSYAYNADGLKGC